MSAWYRRGWGPRLLAVALAAGLGAAGCGKKAEPAPQQEDKPASPAPAAQQAEDDGPKIAAAVSKPSIPAPAPIPRDRLHQSFADAALDNDNPPTTDGELSVEAPVSKTVTGKSAPELYEQVVKAWDTVRFTTPDGRKIDHVAELTTSHGLIKLAILPELAPNHARNFLVLAKLGYYDGLRFDRIHYDQFETGALHCLEAGCPMGTGEHGTGSIGYWLKNENTPPGRCSHTEGVVGAYREVEPNGAATMFYVNLNSAPFRDGHYAIFAKVIEGLDVVRTMSKVSVTPDPTGNNRSIPTTPLIIHKVTVQENTSDKK